MVKKLREKAKLGLTKLKANNNQESEQGNGSQPPHRLQKKLLKKVAFLEKLAANRPPKSNSAGVQKKKKKRPSVALNNYASLAESLRDAAARAGKEQQKLPGASVNTLKARERIANEESERLQKVLQHPQFLADPLAAIASHLESSLPPPPPPPPKPKMDARQKKMQKKLKKQKLKMEQQSNALAF